MIEFALGDFPPTGTPCIAVLTNNRGTMLDLLFEVKELQRKRGSIGYFEITMPCGYSRVFREPDDIPHEDLPCPCGDSKHWLIRYTEA